MEEFVRFDINREKAIEALVYVASKRPGIDVFQVCKIFFYADLSHFRKYGRPVTGDQYYAMKNGPVPSFIYDAIKRNLDPQIVSFINDRLEFDSEENYYRMTVKRPFDESLFSRTDIACIDEAINQFADMPFRQLWDFVHDEPAYKATYREGTSTPMPFELLLPDDTPDREAIIEQLRETSHLVAI
jgi:uncharacterized phage-associated protein